MANALIILGAGASFDVVPPEEFHTANGEYRSPLVDGVFSSEPTFQAILNRYPDASVLAETIRYRMRDQGHLLEPLLREFRDSADEHISRQFKEVPLYLQELFGEISRHYTRGRTPPNYAYLVNELFRQFSKVAFVTTNYDLFLEQVLHVPTLGGPIDTLDWYTNHSWLLIKLHGSVNGGKKILTHPNMRGERSGLDIPGLQEVNLDKDLDSEFLLLPSTGPQTRWVGNSPCYPALVVPIQGKYGFACPDEHIKKLEALIPECKTVLIIGHSGQDVTLLKLLGQLLPKCEVFVLVGKERDEAKFAAMNKRITDAVPQLLGAHFTAYEEGFTEFLRNQGVEKLANYGRREL